MSSVRYLRRQGAPFPPGVTGHSVAHSDRAGDGRAPSASRRACAERIRGHATGEFLCVFVCDNTFAPVAERVRMCDVCDCVESWSFLVYIIIP